MRKALLKARSYLLRLERDDRLPMLTAAASYLWHRGKNLRDLPYMGVVRREIARGGVPADIEGQVSFVMDRFGGSVRPIQDRHEITELVRRVADRAPRTVLEIGTARGGTLFLLCRAAHDEALIISLDLPYGRNGGGFPRWKEKTYQTFAKPGQQLVLQRGNSHDPASFAAVETLLAGRKLDFIMIDGDHSYEGVRQDFEMYSRLLAPGGMIALHDVVENRGDPSIDVSRFWAEIAARYDSEEIVHDVNQGRLGIGLVRPAGSGLAA